MISINKKCTAFVCLLGLAFLVACQAAELPPSQSPPTPPAPKEEPAQATPAQPAVQNQTQRSPASTEEDLSEDMADEEEEDFDDEWEDYNEDEEEDGESGPEEELAWLAQQHYLIKSDCADLNETMSESNPTQVDPELKEAYQNCTSELKGIQTAIRELVDQIVGSQ